MIRLEEVSKRFANSSRFAVRKLSLEIEAGETVVLVGPSGCGKTTTMKMINRLVEPTEGLILVDGKDVTGQDPVELRRGIGYAIQTVGLLPHKRIADNIATVPQLLGWPQEKIAERVGELAAMLELDPELLSRYPRELSGGQRQRVGVARALAADPQVLLMDEPFAAVDPVVRARLQDQFLDIQSKLRKTIVFVTHDIGEAIKMADRIALLNVGGVLEQFATPMEVLSHPASDFVAEFVGGERGLMRLALVAIGDVKLERGPVVDVSDSPDGVRKAMAAAGYAWAGVLAGGRFAGIITSGSLKGVRALDDLSETWGTVRPGQSLRAALDAAVSSPDRVAAVVTGDGEYAGALSAELIGHLLARMDGS